MYKALLTDIDGTLAVSSPQAIPSQKVQQAIQKAQKKIHIGIATSRPLHFTSHIFQSVPLSGPCIVSGGAQVYNASTQTVVWNKAIETESFWQIIEVLRKSCDEILINEACNTEDTYFSSLTSPDTVLGVCVKGVDEKLADELIATISRLDKVVIHKLISHFKEKVDINISHSEATKQHGVLKVAEFLDIAPSEMIGVGDGLNDFPLLMACGLKVAMGNAVDELKAIADYIAPSVDDDGLADVIEKFVL